jgi:hypothetical protein
MEIDPSTIGQDYGPIPADQIVPQNVNFVTQGGEQVPTPEAWKPSFLSVLSRAMHGNGDMGAARAALEQQHTAGLFAERLAGMRDEAAQGMTPQQQYALFADPDSYAQAMNKNYEPRDVEGGNQVFGFGKPQKMVPKVGVTPEGVGYAQNGADTVQTGQLAQPMSDAQRAEAENRERATGFEQQLLAPKIALMKAQAGQASRSNQGGAGGGAAGGGLGRSFGVNVGGVNYTPRAR